VLGTALWSFGGFLDAAAGDARLSAVPVLGRSGLFVAWEAIRAAVSALKVGSGGGYGEMDTPVTDAEWAW